MENILKVMMNLSSKIGKFKADNIVVIWSENIVAKNTKDWWRFFLTSKTWFSIQKHKKYLTSKNGIKTAQNPLFKELWPIFEKRIYYRIFDQKKWTRKCDISHWKGPNCGYGGYFKM